MTQRLSETQRQTLRYLSRGNVGTTWNTRGAEHVYSYIPSQSQCRTYNVLERYGYIKFVRVDDGWKYNGYVITPEGRAAINTPPNTAADRQH